MCNKLFFVTVIVLTAMSGQLQARHCQSTGDCLQGQECIPVAGGGGVCENVMDSYQQQTCSNDGECQGNGQCVGGWCE